MFHHVTTYMGKTFGHACSEAKRGKRVSVSNKDNNRTNIAHTEMAQNEKDLLLTTIDLPPIVEQDSDSLFKPLD